MPKKDFLSTIPSKVAGQSESQYLESTKAYIKQNRSDLDDEVIDIMAKNRLNEYKVSNPEPVQKKSNPVSEYAKTLRQEKPAPPIVQPGNPAQKAAFKVDANERVLNNPMQRWESQNVSTKKDGIPAIDQFDIDNRKNAIPKDVAERNRKIAEQLRKNGFIAPKTEAPQPVKTIFQQDGIPNADMSKMAESAPGLASLNEKIGVNESAPSSVPNYLRSDYSKSSEEIKQAAKAKNEELNVEQYYSGLADKELPQNATPEMKAAYINTAKGEHIKNQNNELVTRAQSIPDDRFFSDINLEGKVAQWVSPESSSKGFTKDFSKLMDKDEFTEWITGPQFKQEFIKRGGYDKGGQRINVVTDELIEEKKRELEGLPSVIQQKVTALADILQANNDPLSKTLYAGLNLAQGAGQGMLSIGGAAEALGKAALAAPKNYLTEGNTKIGETFAEQNARNQEIARGTIPSFQSANEGKGDGVGKVVDMLTGSLPRELGKLMGPAPAVGKTSIFSKLLGKAKGAINTERLASAANVAEQAAYAGNVNYRTNAANTFLQSLNKVAQSSSPQKLANFLDNSIGMTKLMGGSMYDGYYQEMRANGWSVDKAAEKAGERTLLTTLPFGFKDFIHAPQVGSLTEELFKNRSIASKLKGGLMTGLVVNAEMGAAALIDAKMNHVDAIERGEMQADAPMDWVNPVKEILNPIHVSQNLLLGAIPNLAHQFGRTPSDMQTAAITHSLENPTQMMESIVADIKTGKLSPEQADQTQAFINTVKPIYENVKRTVDANGKPKFTPAQATQISLETARGAQAAEALNKLDADQAGKMDKYYQLDDKGNKVEVPQYLHEDGVYYDYQSPKVVESRKMLVDIVESSKKNIAQIQQGTYLGNRLVGADEVAAIAEKNSPKSKLKEGQADAIQNNGPYKIEPVELSKFENDPEIQKEIEKFRALAASGQEVKDFRPIEPVIDADGKIIDGKKSIAAAIFKGGSRINVLRPIDKVETKEITDDAGELQVGSDAPKFDGLDEIATKALAEMRDVYDNHLANNDKDYDGAMRSVAYDAIERGYEKADVVNMLSRVNNGLVSDVIAEGYYNDAIKNEKPVEVNPEQFKAVPIGEEGFFKIVDASGKDVGDDVYLGEKKANEAIVEMKAANKGVENKPAKTLPATISNTTEVESGNESRVEELVGKEVEFNGIKGVVIADEGGKLTLENKNTIIELSNGDLAKEILPPAIEVNGDIIKIDKEEFEFVSTNLDSDGNVVSVTLKNENGKVITKRDAELALDIAIAKNNWEFENRELPRNPEQSSIESSEISSAINVEFQKEFEGMATDILENLPEVVEDTLTAFRNGVSSIAPENIQEMVIQTSEWIDAAKQKVREGKSPKKEKQQVITELDNLQKQLNKYYEKIEKQRLAQIKNAAKAKTGEGAGNSESGTNKKAEEGKVKKPEQNPTFEESKNQNNVEPKSSTSAGEPKNGERSADGQSSENSGSTSKKPKGKVTGTAKKRAPATIKNKTYLTALEVESPDPTTRVMQYFIAGGRVSPDTIRRLYKNSNKELKSKIGFIKNDAPGLDALAHKLYEEHTSLFGDADGITDVDYRNAIEDVLNSYTNRTSMAEEVASQHPEAEAERYYKELEEAAKKVALEHEEYVSDAMDMFAELTPEEVERILAEIEAANSDVKFTDQLADKFLAESDSKLFVEEPKKAPTTKKETEDWMDAIDEIDRKRLSSRFFDLAEKVRKNESGDLLLSSPIPPHLISDSIKLLATGIKAGEKLVDIMARIFKMLEKKTGNVLTAIEKRKIVNELLRKGIGDDLKSQSLKTSIGDVMTQMKGAMSLGKGQEKQRNAAHKEFTKRIKELLDSGVSDGVLTTSQLNTIFNKAKFVSGDPVRMQEFKDFMDQTIDDVLFATKLKKADGIKAELSKLAKSKVSNIPFNVSDSVKAFLKLDPEKVSDIDQFNDIAEKVLSTAKKPSIRIEGGAAEIKNEDYEITTKEIDDYVDNQNKILEKKYIDNLAWRYKHLVDAGVLDPNVMSLAEMRNLIKIVDADPSADLAKEGLKEAQEAEKRNAIQKVVEYQQMGFDSHIEQETANGKTYTQEQQLTIDNLKSLELDNLSVKDLIELNGVLNNYVTNGSLAGAARLSVVSELQKEVPEVKSLMGKLGAKARKLFGENMKWLNKFTSIPTVFKNIFSGDQATAEVQRTIGVSELFDKHAKASIKQTEVIKEYKELVKSIESTDKNINDIDNRYRRGVMAFVEQHYGGTDAEMQAEFTRLKGIVLDSVKKLNTSTKEAEQHEAKVLESVYAELLEGSETVVDVESKLAALPSAVGNRKIIDFWKDKHAANQDATAEHAEIYNNQPFLEVQNYTSTTLKGFDGDADQIDGDLFRENINTRRVDTKAAGTKIARKKMNALPDNNRVYDFDFDAVQAKRHYETILDVNTAHAREKLKAFFNMGDSKELLGGSENKKYIQDALAHSWMMQKVTYYTDKVFEKVVNYLTARSARMALGSVAQLPMQYISVMTRSMINAGLQNYVKAFSIPNDSPIFKEHNIGLRGETKAGYVKNASAATVNRALLGESAKNRISNAIKVGDEKLTQASQIMMKPLEFSDVSVARTSWLAYYIKSLKEQGMTDADIDAIDWSTYKGDNKKAAAYAETVVATTQNANDSSSMGENYHKGGMEGLALKVGAPFNSFAANMRAAITANTRKLLFGNKIEKGEAAKDLGGIAMEAVVFNTLKTGIALLTSYAAYGLLQATGNMDEEEAKDLMDDDKGKATGKTVQNIGSDLLTGGIGSEPQKIANKAINKVGEVFGSKDDLLSVYENKNADYLDKTIELLGGLGIAPSEYKKFSEDLYTVVTGETDHYGKGGAFAEESKTSEPITDAQRNAKLIITLFRAANILGFGDTKLTGAPMNKADNYLNRKIEAEHGGGTFELTKKAKGPKDYSHDEHEAKKKAKEEGKPYKAPKKGGSGFGIGFGSGFGGGGF